MDLIKTSNYYVEGVRIVPKFNKIVVNYDPYRWQKLKCFFGDWNTDKTVVTNSGTSTILFGDISLNGYYFRTLTGEMKFVEFSGLVTVDELPKPGRDTADKVYCCTKDDCFYLTTMKEPQTYSIDASYVFDGNIPVVGTTLTPSKYEVLYSASDCDSFGLHFEKYLFNPATAPETPGEFDFYLKCGIANSGSNTVYGTWSAKEV